MLEGQRILVTGATGQVARPIAEKLNARNEVWAAARFSDADAKRELEALGIRTARFSSGEADLSALPDVDYVIHAGCNTNPKTPELALANNAEGTGFLMQRYRDAKAFFHFSSSSVYREAPDPRQAIVETDPLGGYSNYSPHYAMSKLAGESVVRYQARALGLPTVIARLNVAYGTCGHGGVPSVLFQMMKAGAPLKEAAGRPGWASPIHEDDIAAQVEALLERATVPATVVNLGGDEAVSFRELAEYIASISGLEAKLVDADAPLFDLQVLDAARRQELGGPCRVRWKEGVRSALAARYPDALA